MSTSNISDKQLAANRANAQKSTGPKTEEGKNKVRRNACRHHLTGQVFTMTDEDYAAYEVFTKGFVEDLNPEGSLEITLVQSVADGYWRLNRAVAIENNTFALEAQNNEHLVDAINDQVAEAVLQAMAFFKNPEKFALQTLYEQRIHRKTHKDLQILMDRQAARKQTQKTTLAPKAMTATESTTYSEPPTSNGFVFSNPLQPQNEPDSAAKTGPEPPDSTGEIPKAA